MPAIARWVNQPADGAREGELLSDLEVLPGIRRSAEEWGTGQVTPLHFLILDHQWKHKRLKSYTQGKTAVVKLLVVECFCSCGG
jgi:hypothetical protein